MIRLHTAIGVLNWSR